MQCAQDNDNRHKPRSQGTHHEEVGTSEGTAHYAGTPRSFEAGRQHDEARTVMDSTMNLPDVLLSPIFQPYPFATGNTQYGDAIQRALNVLEGRPGNPRSFDALDTLLNSQPYRLSYWRVAGEENNYRRFFDVNELAAIKVENPMVPRVVSGSAKGSFVASRSPPILILCAP